MKKCTSTKYGTLVQIRAICNVYLSAFMFVDSLQVAVG